MIYVNLLGQMTMKQYWTVSVKTELIIILITS